MKKLLFIIGTIILLILSVGCSSEKTEDKTASLSSDFSSIMQELSKNYEVKAINNYTTDAIPNTDGYEFTVDGKPLKILKMQESDFNEFNFEGSENDFLNNIKLEKNSTKPYIAFVGKDDSSGVLDVFKDIDIK